MVNKKGYLKTIEAVIAVLILLGFFIYMLPDEKPVKNNIPSNVLLMQDAVFEEISNNVEYRRCIVREEIGCINEDIKDFIKTVIPKEYGFQVAVCADINTGCNADLNLAGDSTVYAADIIIQDLDPSGINLKTAIFKLFIWSIA